MVVKCNKCEAMIDTDVTEGCAFCDEDGLCDQCLEAHEEACAESED